MMARGLLDISQEAVLQIIEVLQFLVEHAAGMDAPQAFRKLMQFLQVLIEAAGDNAKEVLGGIGHEAAAGEKPLGEEFGGSTGSGSAEIGDKIADGKIDFVAHGRDDRDRGVENGSCDAFFVEGPEVFEAAATPCD